MRRVLQSALVLLFAMAALLLASPYILYRVGLHGVEGRPQKPGQLATEQQQASVWKAARGEGAPQIGTMNPYSMAAGFLIEPGARTPAGERIAWQVASDYLLTHRRRQGTLWWHLSGAALMIWLTRNWSDEEILSAAFQASTNRVVRREAIDAPRSSQDLPRSR